MIARETSRIGTPDDVVRAFADGLCEPNPGGVATFGFVIETNGAEIHREGGLAARGREQKATNNLAEYTAAIKALSWLLHEGDGSHPVLLHSDSQLLIRQITGAWQVRSPAIRPLWREARSLMDRFVESSAVWIPRDENETADALSVEAYVTVLEADRAARADDVSLEVLGKLLYRANGRYLVDLLLDTCQCPDWRRVNSNRFSVRCKHLIKAASERAPSPARTLGGT